MRIIIYKNTRKGDFMSKIKNIYVKRENKGEITEERLDEYLQKLQNYIMSLE